jgi:hypothetical protein
LLGLFLGLFLWLFLLLLFLLFLLFLLLFLLLLLLILFGLLFFFVLHFLAVVSAQELLDLAVCGLDVVQGLLDRLERDLIIWFVDAACLVLAGAEVLDLLAAILNLDQTECGR